MDSQAGRKINNQGINLNQAEEPSLNTENTFKAPQNPTTYGSADIHQWVPRAIPLQHENQDRNQQTGVVTGFQGHNSLMHGSNRGSPNQTHKYHMHSPILNQTGNEKVCYKWNVCCDADCVHCQLRLVNQRNKYNHPHSNYPQKRGMSQH